MNKNYRVIIITAVVFLLQVGLLKGQVTNSVYSMFGVGQLIDNNFGINKSLGGTGIAFQSGRSINYLNPSSYMGLLPKSYVVEAGVYGMYGNSSTANQSESNTEINLNYFSISLYLTDWWATSVGIVPYSSVGYEINSSDEIDGELTLFTKRYEGSGGLNKIYWGNSFRVFGGLSAGLNISYLGGHVNQTEIAESSGDFTGYELTNKMNISGLYLDYGLQYSFEMDDLEYTLGLTYSPGQILSTTNELDFEYNSSTTTLEDYQTPDIKIPKTIGVGLAVKSGAEFRAGIDYEWRSWNDIVYSNAMINTKNSSRFSAGVEYTPGGGKNTSWYEDLCYRIGAKYKNSYLEIDDIRINSMAFNLGIGIPYDTINMINLSLEYGREGTTKNGLISNSYWMFYVSISFHDFWKQVINR